MPKHFLKKLILMGGLLFLYGCGTTGIEVQSYTQEKARVDQEMGGNAGYLTGTPQPDDRGQYKKTRKVYVVEISKARESRPEHEERVYVESTSTSEASSRESQKPLSADLDVVVLPPIGESKQSAQQSPNFVEYTVEKDDTLQKISKKFYDSYSKWPRIYEANKEKIQNPDKIKPGITINIPVE